MNTDLSERVELVAERVDAAVNARLAAGDYQPSAVAWVNSAYVAFLLDATERADQAPWWAE